MSNKLNNAVHKVVIVDPGKNTVKAFCFSPDYKLLDKVAFPSKSMEKRNFFDIDSSSENQFKVVFEGKKYVVGEGLLSDFNFETTKNTFHHKLCVYTAIGHLIDNGDIIHLVLGYPSSDFVNIEQRAEYVKLISSDDPITVTVNEDAKTFTIASIGVQPEGVAMRPRVMVGQRAVRTIDIGGENINYRYYDAKGNTLASQSLDGVGVNHLEAFMKTKLRKFVNVTNVNIDCIDFIEGVREGQLIELRDDDLTNYANSAEFVEDAVLEFIETKILNGLKAKGMNLYQRGDKIIFTGGGSVLLKPYFEKVLTNSLENLIFSDTAYWDNCISYAIKDIGDRAKKASHGKAELMENMKIANQCGHTILRETDSKDSQDNK